MATVKSLQVTNIDAGVREPGFRDGGALMEACSTVVTAADESASNDLMLVRVPSNARISQVLISHADATTTGAIDIGIWSRSMATGAAVYTAVDDDLFASAYVLTSGPVWNFDVTNESAEYTEAEQQLPLWQVLGLASDPGIDYYVGSDITTVFSGGPLAINLKVRYVR